MNTSQYSMPADQQAINPRAREMARRRRAYQAIDAAYRAHLITETARELAKWYVRQCCGVRAYHDLTQAAQACQFGLSRRTIITLVQQLVAADLIWLEPHGTRNRTYMTAYEVPPDDEVDDAPSDDAPDVEPPAYQQLRAAADTALATGDTARAAMYEYQAAMELAHLSNTADAPFFSTRNGDLQITNNVQSGSPSTVNKDSSIPNGDTESSVCTADGDDGASVPQQTDPSTAAIPDTEATRLLRSFGVLSPALLRKHAAAPLELIRRAEARRVELGYSAGLIGRILDDGGVMWGRCGQQVDTQVSRSPLDGDYVRTHTCPQCGAVRAELLVAECCYACGYGASDPPPDTEPADDPELRKYRDIDMPCWGAGDGP